MPAVSTVAYAPIGCLEVPSSDLAEVPVSVLRQLPKASSQPGVTNTSQTQPHVIVVGAGISGLRAASVLQRHGIRVTVLEGRDRIGGRIFTTRKQGTAPRDIGAAWMHETSQNKLAQLISKLGIDHYYDDGPGQYYTEHGLMGPKFKANKVADEFADHCEEFYSSNPDALDRSVMDFMHEFVDEHMLLTPEMRHWAPAAIREVELWLGASMDEASAKHMSYCGSERNLYMKGGYDKIVEWTAEPLRRDPETIRFNEVVRDIRWDIESSVVVDSFNVKQNTISTLQADAIVVSVPLGVLRRTTTSPSYESEAQDHSRNTITFSPEIPPSIQKGIRSFSYGALGKVFVEFASVFWPEDHDRFVFYPSPSIPRSNHSILSNATETANLFAISGCNQLCVQVCEPFTQHIETLSPPCLLQLLTPLFLLLRTDPSAPLPEVLSVQTTAWTQDDLAGCGTYSVEKVGDDPHVLYDALEANKTSRLQFAGEHCIFKGNGCVNGAFETGEVAARNLVEGCLGWVWDGLETTKKFIHQ